MRALMTTFIIIIIIQLTETEMPVNWNRSNPLTITVIETEIHAKTVIETKLKYIANNGIEIETEIYLITDTTLHPLQGDLMQIQSEL